MPDPRSWDRVAKAAAAFTSNARNPNLRRAQLSFLGAWTAEWAFTVGLGIVAYRDGGATAVGLVGLLRMAPSAILAPLLSPLADRGRRERVLILVSTLRGVATVAAAVVVGFNGPTQFVYALAVLSTIAATLFRPAHSALLPSLCHTGSELAGANVVRGLLDAAATLVGPLLAAVLLQFTGVTVVFAMAGGASLWSAALLVRLRYDAPPRPSAPETNLVQSAMEGIRAVSRNGDLALIMGLAVAQTLVRGALTVLTVVVAINLLETGEPGVGILNAAVGAGAVLGAFGASMLVNTGRLGAWFAVGVALWGVPLLLLGAFPQQVMALVLLALVGVGNSLIDLGGFTLLARLAPDEVLARVFGVLESLVALSMGVGAIIASLLIEEFGVRPALLIIGLLCPVAAAASWRRLRGMDRSVDVLDREVAALQTVPMLSPLPLPAIERLARGLEPAVVPAGCHVFDQGDVGDRYFVIDSGVAEVVGDGRVVAKLRAGQGFGEIALLRSIRRTATVRASSELRLQVLRSDRFLPVVLGYTPSAVVAGTAVDTMLDRFTPRDRLEVGFDGSARENTDSRETESDDPESDSVRSMESGQSLLLIADIGGYTDYMRSHRMSLAHAEVNTSRLLAAVIDAAPGFELIEIEGDAAFLSRRADSSERNGTVASTLQVAMAMHRAFHVERQYVATNLCPCDGCTQANNLKLKFVAHIGEVATQTIRDRRKLVGIDVILVHRLLKNPVEVPEYVLLSEELYNTAGADLPGPAYEVSQDVDGIGQVRAYFLDVDDLTVSVPPLPDPSLFGRLGRTLGVAGAGMPYMLGLRRGRRTVAATD